MLDFIGKTIQFFLVSFVIGFLFIMFAMNAYTDQANTFIANNQKMLRDANLVLSTPEYMEGGIETKTQATDPAVLKKSKVKTCEQFIKIWKPAHLPAGVKVECNNQKVLEQSKNTQGYTLTQSITPRYYAGGIKIYLRDDANVDRFIEVYNHEAYHAVSFSWSEEKQERFLQLLGADSWSGGDYMDKAAERWAWAATSCKSQWEPLKGYDDMVPGQCKEINKWLKNSK